MLDKKMAVVVVALTLLSATMASGVSNLVVIGSGIVRGTAIEAELLYNENNADPRVLIITDANEYLFNGVIDAIIDTDGSTYVEFLVTDKTNKQYLASATRTDLNTWTLSITNPPEGVEESYPLTGRLQIITT